MRCVLMGTGPFAVPLFRRLHSGHDVPLLVTRPSAAGPSRKGAAGNPMRKAAEALGVPVFAPEDANSEAVRQRLAELQPDVLVVCDFGQILSAQVLGIAPLGGINLHGSLLPKYRGAAPVNWAIALGDTETGVTVIHMTPRLDAGPCLVQVRTPIDQEETAPELEHRLAELGAEAATEALNQLAQWDRQSPIGCPQNPAEATRAPRIRKEQGQIDWRKSARDLRNQIRAFQPWPGTFTYLDTAKGEPLRLIIDRAAVVSGASTPQPGTVLEADGRRLVVACGQDALSIERIQPAGKRVLAIDEFLRGHRIPVGYVFPLPRGTKT